MTTITGNTYPVKDAIKALGGKWNADKKAWIVPDDKAEQARRLVAGAPTTVHASTTTHKSGTSVQCVKCRESLSSWEKNHSMRLCRNCRDGGGNARGGMSYRDRNGNFVMGDDD